MKKKVLRDHSRNLDQFYTNPCYAESFLDKIKQNIDLNSADVLLEPSAGNGSFYNLLCEKKRIGLDLDPKLEDIIKQDFFNWYPDVGTKVITIGNPPFGKNASLAVKFFNYAAKFSDAIAFVLPKTFNKASIINRLDKKFHLIYNENVPENSFIFNNQPYDVWCCSQIWIKKSIDRPKIKILKLDSVKNWFEIVEPVQADFSIQRVGGRAGTIRTNNFKNYSKQSHYFIKQHDKRTLKVFQSIDFEQIKNNTAGNPSISPSELVKLWLEKAKDYNII
jgi:predicted RNA methylase